MRWFWQVSTIFVLNRNQNKTIKILHLRIITATAAKYKDLCCLKQVNEMSRRVRVGSSAHVFRGFHALGIFFCLIKLIFMVCMRELFGHECIT